MNRTFLPRAVVLLILILLLAVPTAQAADWASTSSAFSVPSGLVAWDVVSQAWNLLTRVWAENGCILEPDGRCLPGPSASAETDNGCRADPNGRCGS
jgi:hypothetical protein